jgi:chromate transporter
MMDGLGFAETTPGPLILVVQFVGFLGAHHHPEGMRPIVAGVLGSVVVLWVTFVPSFVFVFLGGPYIERLRSSKALASVLNGITAAVVGVILNLAVWFAAHTLFGEVRESGWGAARVTWPELASINIPACGIAALAMLAMWRFKRGTLQTLGGGVVLGIGLRLLGAW